MHGGMQDHLRLAGARSDSGCCWLFMHYMDRCRLKLHSPAFTGCLQRRKRCFAPGKYEEAMKNIWNGYEDSKRR